MQVACPESRSKCELSRSDISTVSCRQSGTAGQRVPPFACVCVFEAGGRLQIRFRAGKSSQTMS